MNEALPTFDSFLLRFPPFRLAGSVSFRAVVADRGPTAAEIEGKSSV